MNGGRIGKVRLKANGFEFRVIDGPPDPGNDMGAHLLRCSRSIAAEDGLCGVMILAVTEDGGYHSAFRWDDGKSPIPRTLMPSYVAEIVRRELITDIEAERVFHENFEWVDG